VCYSVCIKPIVMQGVVRGGECSGCRCRWLVRSGRRQWRGSCCCCCPYCSSQSVVQRLDGIGDDEHECAFVVLMAVYPNRVSLGCLCRRMGGGGGWYAPSRGSTVSVAACTTLCAPTSLSCSSLCLARAVGGGGGAYPVVPPLLLLLVLALIPPSFPSFAFDNPSHRPCLVSPPSC
jgi:hypothetical protein